MMTFFFYQFFFNTRLCHIFNNKTRSEFVKFSIKFGKSCIFPKLFSAKMAMCLMLVKIKKVVTRRTKRKSVVCRETTFLLKSTKSLMRPATKFLIFGAGHGCNQAPHPWFNHSIFITLYFQHFF